MSTSYKSKAAATWLALALGSFGVHRLYLRGFGDKLAWLHPLPTLIGLYGVHRMDLLGQDDRLAWLLIPFLGVMLVQGMICGIVIGLTQDERWNARWNEGLEPRSSGWAAIIGVVFCVFLGGICMMSTIAFSAQKYFENQT